MEKESLYDLSTLKKHVERESEIPHYIAKFIVNIAEDGCNNVLGNYLKKKNLESKRETEKLKMSMSMYGIHAIEKEIDTLMSLIENAENYQDILPVIKKIKAHLRLVKNQMLKDFKMVITLVN